VRLLFPVIPGFEYLIPDWGVLREFAGTVLMYLFFLGAQTAVLPSKVKNSRLNGKNREWRRYQQAALRRSNAPGSHALSVSRSIG
jgi:hypothetical protein